MGGGEATFKTVVILILKRDNHAYEWRLRIFFRRVERCAFLRPPTHFITPLLEDSNEALAPNLPTKRSGTLEHVWRGEAVSPGEALGGAARSNQRSSS